MLFRINSKLDKQMPNQLVARVNDLNVYKASFKSAMEIYHLSGSFPSEEKYSLTDQIRRSSRSVCSNLSECWYLRNYPAAFVHKLSDCIREAAETKTWLEFASGCSYLNDDVFIRLYHQYEVIISQLVSMQNKKHLFCHKP